MEIVLGVKALTGSNPVSSASYQQKRRSPRVSGDRRFAVGSQLPGCDVICHSASLGSGSGLPTLYAWSVFVVVVFVSGVAMPVVEVIDVVSVRHRDVSTGLAVCVTVRRMSLVCGRLALVVVTTMGTVQVPVMDVVNVVLVRNSHMPAPFAMHMIMTVVLSVRRGHAESPCRRSAVRPNVLAA